VTGVPLSLRGFLRVDILARPPSPLKEQTDRASVLVSEDCIGV